MKSFLSCKLLLVHSAKSHGEANGSKSLKLTEACVVYHQTGQIKPIQHVLNPCTNHLGISYIFTFH